MLEVRGGTGVNEKKEERGNDRYLPSKITKGNIAPEKREKTAFLVKNKRSIPR